MRDRYQGGLGSRSECAKELSCALESVCHVATDTAGVLVVHLVRPLRGQISGVLWTQEMNVGVLEPSDVRSFAWYSSQTAISTFENHHTTAYPCPTAALGCPRAAAAIDPIALCTVWDVWPCVWTVRVPGTFA